VGNKVALALLALAASIVVGACGGTQEAADLAGTSTPTTPIRAGRRHTDPHKGCDAQGINATQLGVGACTEGGVQYMVANYGGLVRLRSIAVAIIDVAVAPGDESASGRTAAPQRDAFLRLKLQVQNRDRVPHRFGFGQTMLGIGESNYLESVEVERGVHPESLARAGTMQPGETLRGDVLFDITESDYQQIQRRGRFFIWNFGDHASAQISRKIGQLGQIRLYAGEASAQPPQQQQRR
jgi:hypothetical protein